MNNEKTIVDIQREYFYSGETLSYEFRKEKLLILKKAIIKYQDEIIKALKHDLNKSETESITTEIGMVLGEISYSLSHLKKNMKPKKVRTSILFKPASSYRLLKPLGVTLIISPWNYPFHLTFLPLVAALSAGNTVVLKPSQYSFETTKIMKQIIEEIYEEKYVSFFLGGREVAGALLEMDFDHIFFTGSVGVGKTVLEKASKNLTKVTLELGGKSPCIVDKDTNLTATAQRIAFGKLINAGQTCIAPDYLICHEDIRDEFIKELGKQFEIMYPNPLENSDYPKIISERHYQRIVNLIKEETFAYGGVYDDSSLKIAPTIVIANNDSTLMKEEIFGPIFPVLTFKTNQDILDIVRKKPYPLAFYIYSKNKNFIKYHLANNQYGGSSVNDCLSHIVNHNLPFGGIKSSGHGKYHGYDSMLTFSHEAGVYSKSSVFDYKFKYMPYSPKIKKLLRRVYLPKKK